MKQNTYRMLVRGSCWKPLCLLLCFLTAAPVVLPAQDKGPITAFTRSYVDSLNKKALGLAPAHLNEAVRLSNKALRIAGKLSYEDGRVHALNNLAIIYRNEGNYSKSLESSRQALRIAYSSDKAPLIGRSYYHLGDLHKVLGNYDKAMSYFKQSFYLFSRSKEYDFAVKSLSNYGHSTMDKGTYENDTALFRLAIKYYRAALDIARQHQLTDREIAAYVNLANAYNVLGHAINRRPYIDVSMAYSLKSLELSEQKNRPIHQGISLSNLAEAMESYGNYPKAIEYYHKAEAIFNTLSEYNWIVYINKHLAQAYEKTGNHQKAIRHVMVAIDIAEKQRFRSDLQDCYALLGNIFSAKKDYASALHYHQQSNAYKDSLVQQKNLIALAGLQLEFESEQKDYEIALLNKDKRFNRQAIGIQHIYRNILIGGCVALFVLLVFVYLRYREKKRTNLEIIRAKESAEKAKELQEQFLNNTSHEIRTPMNGIIGMTQHLLNSHLSPEQREYVTVINESASNLMVIINDLLDMSKIKAGKMSFESRPFSLPDTIRNVMVLLESRTREKNISLRIVISRQVPAMVVGDAVRIQQVLINLAGNAVKFTEEGEVRISVSVLHKEEQSISLRFEVSDTGIGIPAGQLDHIFENFTQVDGKTTRRQGGTGLGLAISRQLVEQMGGTIAVSSVEGQGSVFSVVLRLGMHTAEQNQHIPHDLAERTLQAGNGSKLAGLTVLVVDDNKINRQVASLSLEKWGMHVLLAEGGREAIEQLGHNQVDLVLMDVLMPDMDGFETTRYIRQQMKKSADSLPIIAMTASAIHGERDKCLQAGMNDYISKPFKPALLFELLLGHVSPQMLERSRPAVNLSHLRQKADGDYGFLTDIMETYVTEMPEYLVELNYQFIQENRAGIRAQAHKMKSPAALFGANELRENLQYIELHIEKDGTSDTIKEKLEKVNDLCRRTIDEVSRELAHITKAVK